jgi:hypothetical protein
VLTLKAPRRQSYRSSLASTTVTGAKEARAGSRVVVVVVVVVVVISVNLKAQVLENISLRMRKPLFARKSLFFVFFSQRQVYI